MVARRVAYHSGLEFAIMSGGDVAPLKDRAVTEITSWSRGQSARTRECFCSLMKPRHLLDSRSDAAALDLLGEALNAAYHTGSVRKIYDGFSYE